MEAELQQIILERTSPVRFTGTASEYFRIWIVNMALTIVTLGIYSAWAKVRKQRYFYTNTILEDGHFDYHARPKAILIGRLIAVGMLGIYWASGYVSPYAPLVVIGIIFLLVPWLVVRSRRFQLHNTSFHGIRFHFRRNYKDAFKAYYGGAALTLVTLGLGAPTATFMRNRFAANNSGYGKTAFKFKATSSEFYAIFWKSAGLSLLGVIGLFVLIRVIASVVPMTDPNVGGNSAGQFSMIPSLMTIPILVLYAAIGTYVTVRQRNYVWNSTELGDTRFLSSLSVRDMLGLYLTNVMAIVFTLGLLTPWAQIRLARYRAEHMQVNLADDWQNHLAAEHEEGSALGEEIGEAFDVEIDVAF